MRKRIRNTIAQPKVYSLLLETKKGALLHLGVHYSLDEAYEAAKLQIAATLGTDISDPTENMEIDLWSTLRAEEALQLLTMNEGPGLSPRKTVVIKKKKDVKDHVTAIEKSKNALMKQVIGGMDEKLFNRVKKHFSRNEVKYMKCELEKKNGVVK
jgi:hypothetical protein